MSSKYAKTSGEWVYEYMDYNRTKPSVVCCSSRKDALNKAYEWLFDDRNREAFVESAVGDKARAALEANNYWENDPNGCKVKLRRATTEEVKHFKKEGY